MGMEDKKDNKVDTSRNGRPMSFTTGDGEDFTIDLPNSIPGLEDLDTADMDSAELASLMDQINANNDKMDEIFKELGIDDIGQFLKDNE